MGNTRKEKLTYAFGTYPKATELHVTSDDQIFFTAADAGTHAKTLEDSDVVKEIRSDYITPVKSDDEDDEDKELDDLRAKHKELFGALPNKTAQAKTIQKKIDDELARLAEVAARDAEKAGGKPGENTGTENPGNGKGSDQ